MVLPSPNDGADSPHSHILTNHPQNTNIESNTTLTDESKITRHKKMKEELAMLAIIHLQRGNAAYYSKEYSSAAKYYQLATGIFSSNYPTMTEELSQTWRNVSDCHLKLMDWSRAEIAATLALEADESDVRARFYRAKARFYSGDYGGAVIDATHVLEMLSSSCQMNDFSGGDVEDIRKILGVAQARKKILDKASHGPFNNLVVTPSNSYESTILFGDEEDEKWDDIDWWESAPFCPQNSYETMQLLAQFRRKFGIIPPYDRMAIERAFRGGFGRDNYIDVVQILLSQKFGREMNGLSPLDFAKSIGAFEVSTLDLLFQQFGEDKMIVEGRPRHPTDWHFDHYGTLCALVHAAFCSLSTAEQQSPQIQSRLAEATLSGWEDTPTETISLNDDKAWKGPTPSSFSSMPESWKSGEGTILMHRAWEIWCTTHQARGICKNVQSMAITVESAPQITSLCQNALQLQCLRTSVIAMASSRTHTSNCDTGWDCVGDMQNIYSILLCTITSAHLLLNNPQCALDMLEPSDKVPFQDNHPNLRIWIQKARVLSSLGRFREARDLLQMAFCVMDQRRLHDKSAFGQEYEDASGLLKSIKVRVSPLPQKKPVPHLNRPEWYTFDAGSTTDQVYNSLLDGEYLSISSFLETPSPNVKHLLLQIGKYTKLHGLSHLFPNLEQLVIVDSNMESEVLYNLEPLTGLSALKHLELRLSPHWICQNHDILSPLTHLTQLQRLYISKVEDSTSQTFLFLEKLIHLQTLYMECSNKTNRASTPRYLLDLSKLTHLTSATFVDSAFCSELELRTDLQALRLPQSMVEFTCIETAAGYGDCITKALRSELVSLGVEVHVVYSPLEREGVCSAWRKKVECQWYNFS